MIGRFDVLPALLDEAFERELPVAWLEETALLVAPYGGFPRAIETLTQLARRRPGPPTRRLELKPQTAQLEEQGRATFAAVYGDNTEKVLNELHDLLPGFERLVLTAAYGSVLARDGLSLGQREVLAVAALALAGLPAPLGSHIRGALRNGFPAPVVDDTLLACAVLADERARATLEQARDRLSRKVYTA
ncbi:MAG: hypothetical protein DHS20C15_15650 [Planctomycetota bacterium]|nr:MAG: hypothetical protein DHS20C15_15650 [Planctomycetota bacterium]